MIRVNFRNNVTRKNDNFDENMTIREILAELDVDPTRGTIAIDGATLPVGGLPPFLLSCSCTFVIRYTVYSWYTHFLRPSGAKFLRPHGGARRFGVPKT